QVLREQKHAAVPARRGHVVEGAAEDEAPADDEAPTTRFVDEDEDDAPEPTIDLSAPEPTHDLAAATRPERPKRTVRIADRETGDEPILDPAAVGARYIEPAETTPGGLTPARIAATVVLVAIVAVLVAILLGASVI
ncbi:MAG TPA: hypothetical protein VN238_05660, partial [Solirubrobacteraceae bacterium]|nr:hypothetical protein [Solirubrobacteraceae bacterium]